MSELQPAYIVCAFRTPVGKAPRGVFKNIRPDDLLTHVLKGILQATPELDPNLIDDVIIGCAMPEAEQGMNIARVSSLLAGLPESVPAMTINRFCSSGIQSVAIGADRIRTGAADIIIAGGTESMSLVPLGGHDLRPNIKCFSNNNEHIDIAYSMGITAENVAKKWEISRQAQDEFAYKSHQKALTAQEKNYFSHEILPYEIQAAYVDLAELNIVEKRTIVKQDEGPRKNTTLQALNKLPTVFSIKGTVTAGNSSQMSDGAGAVLLVSERMVKELNLRPIAKMHSFSITGVEPGLMGIGPSFAIPKALKMANKSLQDIAWIELNEAFAAQTLAVIKESDLDPEKVNPLGGAIALGHPLGATGAIRIATLIHGMQRTKQKYGMVTMCVGTGMGAAGIFEVF